MAENASLKRATADLQLQLESIEERYQRLQYSNVGSIDQFVLQARVKTIV